MKCFNGIYSGTPLCVLKVLQSYLVKCGLLHRVEHYVGQIPMAAIMKNRFCDRVIANFVS